MIKIKDVAALFRKTPAPLRLSLDRVAPGAPVVVRTLGPDRELGGRLMQLGIVIGATVEVLQRREQGPMLIRARNTLVALGQEEAAQITVEPAP